MLARIELALCPAEWQVLVGRAGLLEALPCPPPAPGLLEADLLPAPGLLEADPLRAPGLLEGETTRRWRWLVVGKVCGGDGGRQG